MRAKKASAATDSRRLAFRFRTGLPMSSAPSCSQTASYVSAVVPISSLCAGDQIRIGREEIDHAAVRELRQHTLGTLLFHRRAPFTTARFRRADVRCTVRNDTARARLVVG